MDQNISCPMLSHRTTVRVQCFTRTCAWWDPVLDQCVICQIPDQLEGIHDAILVLAKAQQLTAARMTTD